MTMTFSAYGKRFDMILHRTDEIFGKNFHVKVITEEGPHIESVDVSVHYRGYIHSMS